MASQPKTILGIENPLLDIAVDVSDEWLKENNATVGTAHLATDTDRHIFEKIVKFPSVQYIAGGACQNSIRGAQWISPTRGITHFIGSVGDDENGRKLTEVATADGVKVHYYTSQKFRTGTCAVLINNKERGLIADLSAANDYQHSHFEQQEIQKLVTEVGLIYTTGYFLTVSPKTMIELGKHCNEHNKLFVFSIAAPFAVQLYWDDFQTVMKYSDVVVCNEDEAVTFLQKAGIPHDDLKVSVKLVAEYPKINTKRQRTVIFTRSSSPAVVCYNGQVKEYPVLPISKDQIVDSNGAGDAFAGGLIAGLAHDKPIEECIRAAMYAAHTILQVSGSQYPSKCEFQWK